MVEIVRKALYLQGCCSVLQCVAVCCSVSWRPNFKAMRAGQDTATSCNTLQQAATPCNQLERTATSCNALQHAAKHCNTQQQQDSTHCNVLQHTVKHDALQCTARHSKTKASGEDTFKRTHLQAKTPSSEDTFKRRHLQGDACARRPHVWRGSLCSVLQCIAVC